ncbi:uncharacterized protein LOC119745889 isoform X3 [Patiria miniata]|uniref:Uncharacterized protein n=1 Tax=Patiria miniata TaxID=46514 RepID=A0A914BSI7_PATMI|nr:uncharacterized protein LOC119745889 isoform X3 [Patiria miniata]
MKMGWLSMFLLAFCMIGVPEVLSCRVYRRLRDVRTTRDDVPKLCRKEGILAYWYAPSSNGDLRDSIKQSRDLIDSGCSDILGRFLCTAHFPQLDLVLHGMNGWTYYLRPCAEVCRAVWRDCRLTAYNLNIERPPELDCKNLPSQKTDEMQCLPYLYPPRDRPTIVNVTRHNASSVSILYALPEKASLTKAFRVRYNETLSWGQLGRELFYKISRSRSSLMLNITDLKRAGDYTFEVTAFNSFGEGPKTVLSVPAFHNDIGTGCENITVPMCQSGIDYSQTAMPNSLGHWDQEDAGQAVDSYSLLVEEDCSPYTQTLVCAMYIPICTSGPSSTLLPCRDLCVQARNGCEEILVYYGFSWPADLRCESLPSYDEGNDCYLGGAPVLEVSADDQCERITVSMCPSAMGYNQTLMPNSLGHQTVRDAELQLMTLSPVVEFGCSPHFSSFVCSLYLPRCNSAPVLPCRELCEKARNGCTEVLLEFGFQWPEQLTCEDLPSHNDGATCYLGDFQPMPMNKTDFSPPQPNQTTGTMTNATLAVKPRRYDTHNLGVPSLFRGWVDVQGQGAANDYCRVVTNSTGGYFLSCSLAGMKGAPTDLNYNSTGPWFDAGHMDTWYMMDVNEDGRDDYCRCVGCLPTTHVSCLLAGEGAFTAQTLDYDPVPGGCHYNTVNPYFGR